MTKEKLKQEAEESADKWIKWAIDHKSLEYWNSYVDGYLAGAEPREKRIAELEADVKEWKDKADLWCKTANLKDHNIMINKELEKENAELKCECRRCVYTDSPCILSDYGKDRNGICDHFKDVFDKNIELKEQNRKLLGSCEGATMMYEHLTKAKEHIRTLISCLIDWVQEGDKDYCHIAEEEQFLKDCEVEK